MGRVYKTVIGQFLEQISKFCVIVFLLKFYLPIGALEDICFSLILGDVISEIFSFAYLLIAYLLDKKTYFFDSKKSNNDSFLFRILKIQIPIALTAYMRSGLSSIKQIIIPSSLEKSGLSCSNALSTIRYYFKHGNAYYNVSRFTFIKYI